MTETHEIWVDELGLLTLDERECCYRGAMVLYCGGQYDLTYANCLEGTALIPWPTASCNTSYRMFGELERLL